MRDGVTHAHWVQASMKVAAANQWFSLPIHLHLMPPYDSIPVYLPHRSIPDLHQVKTICVAPQIGAKVAFWVIDGNQRSPLFGIPDNGEHFFVTIGDEGVVEWIGDTEEVHMSPIVRPFHTGDDGQTASGAVVVQALSLSTVAREFRAVRRERGAYAVWVDGEPRPRGKGPHLAPERSIAFSAEAIALLGPDGAHLQDLSLALRRELEAIVYLGPLRQRPARDQVWNKGGSGSVGAEGQQAINALLSDALQPGAGQGAVLRSVSAGLQRMGLADRIEVRQLGRSSRYELLVHKDGVAANLRDVGVGVAQVLPVLTVAYSVPPGSTVLLEEPEIHLHPLAQAVLAELFAEVSQQRRVQFLVETHSEHLFRRMQTLLARRQTTTAQCQMLFVERQGANAVLVPLEVDEFGAVRNWPPRFFGDAMGEAREQARARAQRMREAADGGV